MRASLMVDKPRRDAGPFAQRLRRLRDVSGLTQQQLASRAGLSVSVVAQLEQGERTDPRMTTLRALSRALGVSLDVLAGEAGPSQED